MALLVAALVMAGCCGTSARADVMTLGVYFRGIVEREDGTETEVPLSGSFRVLQGGLEKGIIRAGEETLTVDGSDPVTVVPLAESVAGGWDLSDARVTVPMANGGNVTVPIRVRQATGEAPVSPAESPEEPAPETEGEPSEEPENPEMEPEKEPEGTENGGKTESAPTALPAETATPALNLTPVPTAEPTQAPEMNRLDASADTGTFHIRVFLDGNNNGDCGINEKGVAGIPVWLVNGKDETVTGGETDGNGEVTLPGLTPGSYRIRVSLPEEYGFNRKAKDVGLEKSVMDFSSEGIQDSEPFSVSAGETVERGVGLLRGVVVDGVCWLDENANGIMETGEPRIAGAHVTLSGQKNGLHFEAYSDADGYWRVVRLRPGFYDFSGYAPEGMMFTRYSKAGGKNRSVFTAEGKTKSTRTLDLNDGKDEPDQNIGFAWSAIVKGRAFLDANYNGLYDEGEKPLAGVKVTATKQLKEEEVAVTVTGEDGTYVLSGLRGNTYRLRALLPDDGSNFTRAVEDPEGNHFVARDGRRENFWKDFVLKDGESRTVNVGAIYYGSVSGTVYLDDDFSATLSGSEKTSQGVSVTLLDENGAAVDTKQTNAKGAYSFTGLTPGMYSLRMTAKPGYAFTRLGEGNVMLNLNGGEGYSEAFRVPLGESVTGRDAGMILPATVRGTVFADRNDNGRRDSGENGLEGTAVRLMTEEGEAFSAVISDSGEFLFDAVMPGTYYLEYRLPEGAVFAREGGDSRISGEDGLGRGEAFSLRTGETREAPLCGGLTLGRISGTFFHDPDGSGTLDAGDGTKAGMKITLTPERADQEAQEMETGADGSFALENLRPGTWTLSLALPEGMVTARTTGVTLPVRSGRESQETQLEIGMGQRWEDQMIGGVVPASLRGAAWLDENNNGLRDAGERTPAGMSIVMTDEETGEIFETLRTDREGAFGYEGVVPGVYSLSYQLDESTDQPLAGENTFRKEGDRMVMTGLTLREGESLETPLLGLVKYTAMGGQVWIDRGSGSQPLSGARVTLIPEAEDGQEAEATTGEDGRWRFTGLMPGAYRIGVELPEGALVAEPDDERLETGLISVIQETDGREGRSGEIDLIMGEDQLSLNIGSVLPGTIGDFCWLDLNGNGWQDGGELGIPGVRVELVRNGESVAETETDQYGLYFFREVYPAVYTLRVTAPAEVKPTQKRTDIPLIDSALNETEEEISYTDEFAVASDSVDFNIDLGFALRNAGAYPPGYGEQETMDWSLAYVDHTQK